MSHLFTCPHCQTRTLVERRYSGCSGRCVTCGQPITVPPFADGDRGGEADSATKTITESAPQGRSRGPQGESDRRLPRFLFGRAAIAAVVIVITLGILVAGVRYGREAIDRVQEGRMRSLSMRNLEKIATAMRNYAADHGTFPPAMTQDASGRPLHSWRVLILPYLDEEALYRRFDLSVPWDSPENTAAAAEMPKVFRHPDIGRGQRRLGAVGIDVSSYYVIRGPDTMFPPAGPRRETDATDGGDKTLLVVEGTPTGAVSWIQPIDLEFDALRGAVNAGGEIAAGGLTEGGVAVATVDGKGRFVRERHSHRTFRALVTPDGGEPLVDDVFD